MAPHIPARWVVTHHLATADHYDLRLEIAGTLVSWAVPKGPSLDPAVRRMAIRTDDHGMEHLLTEGAFGTHVVQQWDTGTYVNRSHSGPTAVTAEAALARGHLSVWLEGKKLRGGFTLLRTDRSAREMWLLIKKADEHAEPGVEIVALAPASVLTGRTIEQIAAEGDIG